MSTLKYTILASKSHPLYVDLKNLGLPFYDLEKDDPFEGKEARYRDADIIFDFTLIDRDRKEKLLDILALQIKAPVVSDLTCLWGEYFIEKYPMIKGAVATAFWGPTNKKEVYAQDDTIFSGIRELFKLLKIEAKRTTCPGHGFIYPRTISLLINEAFLASEDQLASTEDMDTAMKYGVNYPHGLFEWHDKIGSGPILMLLDDLHHVTKDNRYRASTTLRKQANLN
jgi:3-hydroxybutyryl-CoA dehydrogenase